MVSIICKNCKKKFNVKPSQVKYGYGIYCSMLCRRQGQLNGKFVKCTTCSKKVYKSLKNLNKSKSGEYFCTKECHLKKLNSIQIGSKASNWKHGEYAYREIMKRSKVRLYCILCGNNDKRVLIIHHVDHNRRNNRISNLGWLCGNCHFLVHHYIEAKEELIEKLPKYARD